MPTRTVIEALHMAAGLIGAALLTWAAVWAYPLGRDTLIAIGWCAGGGVVALGFNSLRRAWIADRGATPR